MNTTTPHPNSRSFPSIQPEKYISEYSSVRCWRVGFQRQNVAWLFDRSDFRAERSAVAFALISCISSLTASSLTIREVLYPFRSISFLWNSQVLYELLELSSLKVPQVTDIWLVSQTLSRLRRSTLHLHMHPVITSPHICLWRISKGYLIPGLGVCSIQASDLDIASLCVLFFLFASALQSIAFVFHLSSLSNTSIRLLPGLSSCPCS